MKLKLYTVIILALMLLSAIKPLHAANSSDTTSFRAQLLELYDNEILDIAKELCMNAKMLSQQILLDERVKQASTPLLREFKKNLTDFLHEYPTYKRYGFFNELSELFDDKIPLPAKDKDSKYIWKLLKKHGYAEIYIEYQNEYMRFVKQQFLPKFEELKAKLSPAELKQHEDLLNWCDELKECDDYDCQFNLLSSLAAENSSPRDELSEYVQTNVDLIIMFYGNSAFDVATNVLKDPKLSQLSPAIRQHLQISIDDFMMKFESNQDIKELHNLTDLFFRNILEQYYYNIDIPSRDLKLIVKIFNEHGLTTFLEEYQSKLEHFIKGDLLRKLQEYKTAIVQEALESGKDILQSFNKLKKMNNYSDIYAEFTNLYELL